MTAIEKSMMEADILFLLGIIHEKNVRKVRDRIPQGNTILRERIRRMIPIGDKAKLRFVGMKRVRFNDVLDIKNGRNQRQVENPEGKYPIYGSGGVMGYADDYICNADTVVVGRKGNINKPLYVEEPFWNVDTAFGLEANRELLLPRYLYYFCRRFDFERLNKAVTIPSLTKTDLLNIEMDLPELNEQELIVEKLHKIETVIEMRRTELGTLDELIKARFVEMFGTVRNNVYDYDIKTIQDVCEQIKDGTHQTPRYTEDTINGFKFLSSKDVTTGKIDWTKIKYIPEDLHNELYSRIAPRKGDLLLAKNGTTGVAAIVDVNAVFDIYVSLALLRPIDVDSVYLWGSCKFS